jgi:hypothetical protein
MTGRWRLSLSGVWLISSLAALILPIFLPSRVGDGLSGNALAISALTMFVLSLPSSVFALPLILMVAAFLDLSRIDVAYMTLFILFAVGLLQWFWMVPRLLNRSTSVQTLDLVDSAGNTRLFVRTPETYESWRDDKGATPVERVIGEIE